MLYKDRGRKLVLGLKHGDRTEIARPAGLWLRNAARPFLNRNLLVAPVPLHRGRFMRRRYNQSALLAQELARRTGKDYCPDFLERIRRTRPQEAKTATERFRDVAGAFRVHPNRKSLAEGRAVLLVDDVMTSGATFTACTLACHAAGIDKVFVLALARVAKED